jgi:CheY-like chemotaxis protein
VRTILIVDDESNMRFLLRLVLEGAGYEVVEAPHGAAALERAKESSPDLVVTDLMMPVMTGRELIARLRGDPQTAEIPIVVVSAKPSATLDAVDAVLGKPFDPDELLETARSLSDEGA